MKIAFVWYWNQASQTKPLWRDGLRAAIELIEKDHEVTWFLDEELPNDGFDAYLMWGDSNCPAIHLLSQYKGKKGICLSTNPTNIGHLRLVDTIFCESDPVYEEARRNGLHAVRAFGTDEQFFTPDPSVKKDIEYFYPATFSPWKQQHTIANLGKRLLCIGTVQPDGIQELNACKGMGVQVIEGYLPVEEIRNYYDRTQKMIIPAIHGSERTVLEAMSMNIVPTVAPENRKAHSYLEEYRESGCTSPREFIEMNYSAKRYADALLKGLQ